MSTLGGKATGTSVYSVSSTLGAHAKGSEQMLQQVLVHEWQLPSQALAVETTQLFIHR